MLRSKEDDIGHVIVGRELDVFADLLLELRMILLAVEALADAVRGHHRAGQPVLLHRRPVARPGQVHALDAHRRDGFIKLFAILGRLRLLAEAPLADRLLDAAPTLRRRSTVRSDRAQRGQRGGAAEDALEEMATVEVPDGVC